MLHSKENAIAPIALPPGQRETNLGWGQALSCETKLGETPVRPIGTTRNPKRQPRLPPIIIHGMMADATRPLHIASACTIS